MCAQLCRNRTLIGSQLPDEMIGNGDAPVCSPTVTNWWG
jgi:hypothetical protein